MRQFATGATGGKVGQVDALEADGSVWVTWNRLQQLRSSFRGLRRFTPRRSYRCPDLTLLNPPTDVKEKR